MRHNHAARSSLASVSRVCGGSLRAWLCFVTVLAASACAAPRATVRLVDRAGTPLSFVNRGDHLVVRSRAGTTYEIEITNPTAKDLGAMVSVDGMDVQTGEFALEFDPTWRGGLEVARHTFVRIPGFHVGEDQASSFCFVEPGASYASTEGHPRRVGWIDIAIFAVRPRAQPVLSATPKATRSVHRGANAPAGELRPVVWGGASAYELMSPPLEILHLAYVDEHGASLGTCGPPVVVEDREENETPAQSSSPPPAPPAPKPLPKKPRKRKSPQCDDPECFK